MEKPPLSLRVYSFEEDTKLCVVATLQPYLKKANVWGGKDKRFFVHSYVASKIEKKEKNGR